MPMAVRFMPRIQNPPENGKLKNAVTLISVTWKDEDVDDITEQQFLEQRKRAW